MSIRFFTQIATSNRFFACSTIYRHIDRTSSISSFWHCVTKMFFCFCKRVAMLAASVRKARCHSSHLELFDGDFLENFLLLLARLHDGGVEPSLLFGCQGHAFGGMDTLHARGSDLFPQVFLGLNAHRCRRGCLCKDPLCLASGGVSFRAGHAVPSMAKSNSSSSILSLTPISISFSIAAFSIARFADAMRTICLLASCRVLLLVLARVSKKPIGPREFLLRRFDLPHRAVHESLQTFFYGRSSPAAMAAARLFASDSGSAIFCFACSCSWYVYDRSQPFSSV